MRIYRSDGSAVAIPAAEWLEYLELAKNHGWVPTGTSRPATTFDVDVLPGNCLPWSERYAPACGQVVRREDARRLSIALAKLEAAQENSYRSASLVNLIHALNSGPVLLGEGDEQLRSEPLAAPAHEYANQT